MTLTAHLLADIAGVMADDIDVSAWMLREDIALDAMEAMFDSIVRQFNAKVMADGDVEGAVIDLTGQAFRLGWTCAMERL